jgi:hypothetical protein
VIHAATTKSDLPFFETPSPSGDGILDHRPSTINNNKPEKD